MVERDRVKNLLKANNYSEKEMDLITDFFLNNKKYKETPLEDKETLEKKGKLEKLYIDLIKKEQEKFLEHQDIKKMIVMVSYAEISKIGNILFELPIEKSMRIFPNLDVIYLLYTSGTEEDFEHIKDKFKKNFELKRVEIIGKKVENTLESIYPYLKELVREGKISKNDTVLDLTTGMKISGIALYKLAVERGIKIINWKEEFLALPKNSDGKGSGNVRIPFSICLEVLKEPIRESSRNYERVNSALKNKEYSLVTNLFEVIGDEDKAFLFENIDKIFNLNFILSLDSEYFFSELKDIVNKILSYKKFTADTKNKMKNFITLMSVLAFYDEDYLDNENNLDDEIYLDSEKWRKPLVKLFGSDINIIIDNIIECCYDNDGFFDRESIYDYISLIILENKFKENNSESFNERIFKLIKELIPINSKSIREEIEFISKQKPKLVEALDLENAFKVETTKTIYIKNEKLIIEKFNIEIELPIKEKNHRELIDKVLKSPNYCLSRNDFLASINKSNDDNIRYKVKSNLVNKLNKFIKEELKKNNMESIEFLDFDFDKEKTGLIPIKVNQEFFI